MKLKMSLPSRPGLIHMLPGLDILALILILPLIASSFKSQAGIEIVLPETPHRIAPLERSVQVSMLGTVNPQIWVNKREVKEAELKQAITEEIGLIEGKGTVSIALQVDVKVPSGFRQRILKLLLSEHYRVFEMGVPVVR